MTDILTLLEELQSIARTGLNYSTDPYARAHYTRLLEIAATQYGQALDLPPDEVRARLQGSLARSRPRWEPMRPSSMRRAASSWSSDRMTGGGDYRRGGWTPTRP